MTEHEDYPGQTLRTRDHDTIKAWAQERGARPVTVPETEREDRLGVLRLEFPGYGSERLAEVSWDDWFHTFDTRELEFVYQEHTRDGGPSNFFKVVRSESTPE